MIPNSADLSHGSGARRVRLWVWVAVPTVIVLAAGALVLAHLGESLSSSATVTLSGAIITATGLLLAFTGVIFTGMLSEVRYRSERATQAANAVRVELLERTSGDLRVGAVASFILFATALGVSLGNLAGALATTGTQSESIVFVLPMMLMIGGIAYLTVALILLAFTT